MKAAYPKKMGMMCTICQNFDIPPDSTRSFLIRAMAAIENTATIGITNGVREGILYRYFSTTETRTIRKRKKIDDSKSVEIGKLPDFALRMTITAM